MKKRIISSLFTILLLLSFVGCTTETKKKDFSFEEFGITFEGKEVPLQWEEMTEADKRKA